METDVCVVGGGIVGLATAYRLLEQREDLTLTLLEKEAAVGAHQTSHNSGVLHAGVYYQPGSLKARLTREGKAELEAFAERHGIPVHVNGKVIIAVDDAELGALDELEARARANAVPGLRRVDARELRELEPAATGVAGLHSPTTAVTDFAAVAHALADELRVRGARIVTEAEVVDLSVSDRAAHVVSTAGEVAARVAITCAGLQSDRVADLTGDRDGIRIVPFRGRYLRLTDEAAGLVRGNIYPVPDPRFPFLGVHLTRRVDGSVLAGPNALPASAREGYDERIDWRDLRETAGFPGFWRLAVRHVPVGFREWYADRNRHAYLRQLQRYVPALREDDLLEGPSGIRAQALRPDGTLVDDFSIGGTRRVVHVRNAPSPAATASLAIGRLLAAQVLERLADG